MSISSPAVAARSRRVHGAAAFGLLGLLVAASGACRMYNLEKKLGPADADFYARVQYIMASEERKIFLELPEAERPAFQEEFWKRRDPDPATEENEFKISYFARMEDAEKLFLGEGKPGWMTDRGRVYILFGPPQERITQSLGQSRYGRCSEIWYYGSFPVLFSDSNCSGSYILVTLNLQHLHDMNKALDSFQQTFDQEKAFFDFRWRVETIASGPDRVEARITIETPYSGIWFQSVEGRLRTTFEVRVELAAEGGESVWSLSRDEAVEVDESKLRDLKGKDYILVLPLVVTDKAALVAGRPGRLKITVRNRTGGEEVKKTLRVDF
jgi:GWxTD domain-containing protein